VAVVASRQSSVVLYSDGKDQYCHRVRIVLAVKGVEADIVDVSSDEALCEEVAEINPYGTLPALKDRDFGVFQPAVILAYLDERFPYPPLLPLYPDQRAEIRIMMHDMERLWCEPAQQLLAGNASSSESTSIRNGLVAELSHTEGAFAEKKFFQQDSLTLMDCCLFPFVWRLPLLGIKLPESCQRAIRDYLLRMLEHREFRESLSEQEQEMRPGFVKLG